MGLILLIAFVMNPIVALIVVVWMVLLGGFGR